MKAAEVRRTFLEYFKKQGHEVVASSSLVPQNDPTLLFTNAGHGPVQGRVHRRRDRARTRARRRSQKCVRAGGKHNDLEEVGKTAAPPHVLRDARQLLVRRLLQGGRDRVGLGAAHRRSTASTPTRLVVTVFGGDPELRDRRRRRGPRDLEEGHRLRRRPDHRPRQEGQLLADGRDRADGPVHRDPLLLATATGRPRGRPRRPTSWKGWLEIWNLVFMQFERREAGGDAARAAGAVDRHRRGPRARDLACVQGVRSQLRHRSVRRRSSSRVAEIAEAGVRRRQRRGRHVDARDRRSRAVPGVPDRGRRVPRQGRARVRAAPDHPARGAPRPAARHRASRSCTRSATRWST